MNGEFFCWLVKTENKKQQPFGYCSVWSRRQGAGVRWTPLCKAQKHRPRRQPRPRTCGIFGFAASCGTQNSFRLGAPKNFDRCAISHSLYPPQAAVVFNAQSKLALLANKKSATFRLLTVFGRGDRTRTCGILLPKQARYQTAPRLDM